MTGFLSRLFRRAEPIIARATTADASTIAQLHASSFRRGWSEEEIAVMLADPRVVAERALLGRELCGFIFSRLVLPEAEILSVAVAERRRGHGIAGRLLDHHLRRLAGLAVRTVFLEVEPSNIAAIRLYERAGFITAGRRPGYYPQAQGVAPALVLRRDL
jgi:ribosomal-protein-alanine N-acetyltransferase